MAFELLIHDSVDDLPRDDWDALAPRLQVGLESDHLEAIEASRINDLRPFYLLGAEHGRPAGIAYFFLLDMDFARLGDEIRPDVRQALLAWKPDFLQLRVAECGLLSALGEGTVSANGSMAPFLRSATRELERISRDEGAQLAIVRDVPFDARGAYRVLEEEGWLPVLGFPEARLEGRWGSFDEYFAALKYKKRWALKRYAAKLDVPGIEVETIEDYGEHAGRLAELWEQVHDRSSAYEHERLNAAYFRELNRCLGDRSNVVAIRKDGEIVGFFLNLVGDRVWFSAHCGLDYQHNSQYSLYFNLYLAALREAFARGVDEVSFGVTTYDVKFALGCEAVPLVYYVKHLERPELTPAFADALRRSIAQPENKHRPFKGQDTSGRVPPRRLARSLVDRGDEAPPDVFDKVHSYVRIDVLRFMDLYAFFPPFEGAQEPVVRHRGERVLMLGTNSYLGLGSHPELVEAAKQAIDRYGTGCSGSPLLNGTLDIHLELADALAAFMGKDAVALFSTGYQTNLGVVSTLANWNDVLIMDELSHASLVDGAVLSRAKLVLYDHDDMGSLEAALARFPDRARLVVVDSLFSMEGSLANLPEIVRLKNAYGARLMVDEAHGIGVMGPGGRGVAEHFGVLDEVDLVMGTFSKSFAAVGGFVAGDAELVDCLRHKSRAHVFSASLPPSTIATVRKALEIIEREPERRQAVLANARLLAEGLQELGYDAPWHGTAIVPVICGDELLTLGLFRALLDRGVFVNPVLHPAVPKGQEQLRTSVMATHSSEVIAEALKVFADVRTPAFPRRAAPPAGEGR